MRNRRNIFLISAVIIASAVLIILLNPWSTSGNSLDEFIPETTEKVDRIIITGVLDTIVFDKRSENWYMGEELLNQEAVTNVLIASTRLRMRSIIATPGEVDPVSKGTIGFYSKRKEVSTFQFFNAAAGFFISGVGRQRAFGVELAGYEDLRLERIFSMDRDHFRKHLILDLLPDEIRNLYIDPLTGDPFSIEQDSLYNFTMEIIGQDKHECIADELQVRLLFSYFNAIRYDRTITSDSLVFDPYKTTPDALVRVEDRKGNKWELNVFYWIRKDKEAPDLFEAIVRNGNSETLLVMNYRYLDLILRGPSVYCSER